MSFRQSVSQLRTARTTKIDLVEKVQILLQEARGSGGGAEGTKTTECAQCVYAAAMFNGEKLEVGDTLDPSLYKNFLKSSTFDGLKLLLKAKHGNNSVMEALSVVNPEAGASVNND